VSNRERLFQFLISLLAAAAAVIGARYGIPIPPPQVHIAPDDPIIPRPAPPEKPSPVPNPLAAIGRITFGNAGCTGTIIGPRREDGRQMVLTAAHCVQGQPKKGTMRLRDGRTVGLTVLATDPRSDCAWAVTDATGEEYPFAQLLGATPKVGTKLWHAGYGVDNPGNTETGELLSGPDQNGQVRMRVSVSSGDSGGGICTDPEGYVVSCVCCTSARGQVASVWGASPESIRALMPGGIVREDWQPLAVPIRPEP